MNVNGTWLIYIFWLCWLCTHTHTQTSTCQSMIVCESMHLPPHKIATIGLFFPFFYNYTDSKHIKNEGCHRSIKKNISTWKSKVLTSHSIQEDSFGRK